MENIKNQSIKAYILLESLITMGLLAILVTVVLTGIVNARQRISSENTHIEALNVAKMAVDNHLTKLSANGQDVEIIKNDKEIIIKNHEEKILELVSKN
ncbi:competence type IV pilus minor pilin ComGE [Lactococcus nasutitermitis]|uniref:Competence type IV pilus minor pilin ComGE n=1 Tax=Lactococcus nasutitermitis TaxID=1652957 RepID=A0ABV9JHL8_9LACT|nr:competence type IV pilus minor pilin ComGE [Lactococcus nasutitermitis]